MQVFVNIKDKSGNFEAQMIKEIEVMAARDVKRIAERCEDVIKYIIENTMDGGTGNLESHWNAGEISIPGKVAWGVGDIDELNRMAKYWRHQNWGSIAIGANWQHVLPKGRWVNGRWIESEDGYFDTPKTPIAPKNYIEKTLAQMEIEVPKILAENK